MPQFKDRGEYLRWKAEQLKTGPSTPESAAAIPSAAQPASRERLAPGRLAGAGWAAIALTLLPLYTYLVPPGGVGGKIVHAVAVLVGLVLLVYVLESLRRFLGAAFDFHDVDRYIPVLVWVMMAGVALAYATEAAYWVEAGGGPGGLGVLQAASAILGLAGQALYVVLGFKLLALPDDLFGLLRPFCYAWIVGHGTAIVTTVLFWMGIYGLGNSIALVGLLVRSAAGILLGIVFLRAASFR